MRLSKKVAIITGAGSGIGRGIALRFSQEGARVVCADWNLESAQETAEMIKKQKAEGLAIKVDVSQEEEVKTMVAEAIRRFGALDILVNNAGIYLPDTADSATADSWSKQMDIDLKGVWLGSKYALAEMKKNKKGKIVNVASIAALVGFPQVSSYSAAKGGVISLTRQMALEYAQAGIQINAIAPGVIRTAMTKALSQDPNLEKQMLSQIPLQRIGDTLDIANAALFLASSESDYVTGQTLVVDGGWTIH